MTRLVLAGAVAAALTGLAVPACIALARKAGIMDWPGALKPHTAAVPYLGGIAVYVGLLAGGAEARWWPLLPVGAALVLGVADDALDLAPSVRLAGQALVGGGIAVAQPVHLPGWAGPPLEIVVTVALINACNLLDGLDMLAAGVAVAAGAGFAAVVDGSHRFLAVALTGAALAFLGYNRPPARIFLGDGGSYVIGATAATLLASTWAPGISTDRGVIALAIVVVPFVELVSAVVRRRRSGRSALAGDRGHPYDRLVERGWPRPAASAVYIGAEGLVAVVVVVLIHRHLTMTIAAVTVAAVSAAVLAGAFVAGGIKPSSDTDNRAS